MEWLLPHSPANGQVHRPITSMNLSKSILFTTLHMSALGISWGVEFEGLGVSNGVALARVWWFREKFSARVWYAYEHWSSSHTS